MGKSDTVVKRWLSDKRRCADLFNAEVFGGEQIVCPEDLELISGESSIIFKDKNNKDKIINRYRDITMHWKHGMDFVVLAIENQNKVNYAMPVRIMLYDSLSYVDQIEQIWRGHMDKGEKVTNAEFLSKFKKGDKINPVITIVFYYGEEPWDGEIDLYGMLGIDERVLHMKSVQQVISNYRINLVDVSNVNTNLFVSDLQHVLNVIQYKSDKKELINYINDNSEYFESLDSNSYEMINMLLDSNKIIKNNVTENNKEGKKNMCKALEDLYNEALSKGIEEGREEGISSLILKIYESGMAEESIAKLVDMSVEAVRNIILMKKCV